MSSISASPRHECRRARSGAEQGVQGLREGDLFMRLGSASFPNVAGTAEVFRAGGTIETVALAMVSPSSSCSRSRGRA